jgi:hypothetical protein
MIDKQWLIRFLVLLISLAAIENVFYCEHEAAVIAHLVLFGRIPFSAFYTLTMFV